MKNCYDCGCELSPDQAVRRDVVVSRNSAYGSITNQSGHDPIVLRTVQTARVDLSRECAGEHDRQEAARGRLYMRVLWIGALLFVVAGVALVAVIAIATWPAHVR